MMLKSQSHRERLDGASVFWIADIFFTILVRWDESKSQVEHFGIVNLFGGRS